MPLPGTLHIEFKRCGKQNCRCRNGHPHGPYAVRRWREDGRQRKAHVPMNMLIEVQLAIECHREISPELSLMARKLKELAYE